MEELSKEYVISYFNRTLKVHGDRSEAVGWTQDGQIRHFECLLDIDQNITGKSVLDYGCGKGDFYQFLKDRSISVQYIGFDINTNLISLARKKYPECRFHVFDIEQDTLHEDFDYIFLCGVFNLKVKGLTETIQYTLKKLFEHCRIALAFNALSAHNPKKDFELNYFYPEDILKFVIKNISPSVSINHHRISYDFTTFIYKNNIRLPETTY